MTYKVMYEARPLTWTHQRRSLRAETFDDERAALGRARQLIEDEGHEGVAIHDDSGEVVAGVRLQLKLGFPIG